MVSWGTTANVSMPVDTLDPGRGDGLIATRAAGPGWLLEGGLSGAGSLLEWLSGLLGLPAGDLVAGAHRRPAGANGVVVLPWLGGARAPWWRPEAAASVLGLSASSDPFDVARAAMEGVAYDIARCLESGYGKAGAARSSAGTLECLALGGSGASLSPWVEVLTAVTGVRAIRRRSGEAASAGAALLAAAAVGIELELDRMDPLAEVVEPVPADVAAYERLRPRADRLAAAWLSAAAFARPN
jgi:sugar (pentulose or hexulose) kinase